MQREIQVNEKLPLGPGFLLSLQHLFAMFGSTVLVPNLFGVDPGMILLMNGIGTLLYILICRGKIPAYLGSSFAFISPVLSVLGKYEEIISMDIRLHWARLSLPALSLFLSH